MKKTNGLILLLATILLLIVGIVYVFKNMALTDEIEVQEQRSVEIDNMYKE